MSLDASKETTEKPDRPGVIAPPLAIYLVALAVGLWAEWYWPWALDLERAGQAVGGGLVIAGGVLIRLAMTWFKRAETTVNPYGSSSSVVSDGPFGFSRNPIYVGMTVALVGFSGVFDTAWVALSLLVVLPVMHWGVIVREEAYLERKFGDDYRTYKATVRRWV